MHATFGLEALTGLYDAGDVLKIDGDEPEVADGLSVPLDEVVQHKDLVA
jgi:hypothetical protein